MNNTFPMFVIWQFLLSLERLTPLSIVVIRHRAKFRIQVLQLVILYPFIKSNDNNNQKNKNNQNKAQWLTELLALCESLNQSQEGILNQKHTIKTYLKFLMFQLLITQFMSPFLKILILLVEQFEKNVMRSFLAAIK